MKKFKLMSMALTAIIMSVIMINVKAATFDTKSTQYTDCDSADLSGYTTNTSKNKICKLYSVTQGDAPVESVYCLNVAKDIVWGTYESYDYDRTSLACAVLDVINNESLAARLGINAYNFSGEMNTNQYITSKNISKSDYITVQKYVWNHEKNGTTSCSGNNTKSQNLTAGKISTSEDTIVLTKKGNSYVGSVNVTTSNLLDGYEFTSSSNNLNVTKSSDGKMLNFSISDSVAATNPTYTVTLTGTYNKSRTITIEPFVEKYRCKPGVGNCTSSSSFQELGKLGYIRKLSYATAEVTKTITINVDYESEELYIYIKKVNPQGKSVGDVRFNILRNNNLFSPQYYKSSKGTKCIEKATGTEFEEGKLDANDYCMLQVYGYGTFCIEEIEAPSGYAISKEKVCDTFKKGSKTKLYLSLTDDLTVTEFSKQDATTGKELPGATLQILDKNGKIVNLCTDEKGKTNTKCEWVSTDKPHTIKGLPAGEYQLKETIAPKGYKLTSKTVPFTVYNDGRVNKVVMTNDVQKVEVPATGENKIVFIILGTLFLIGGAGIVGYGIYKNKKANE